MRAFSQWLKAWYLRRFRGLVLPPAQHGGQGTAWQQHTGPLLGLGPIFSFRCRCGQALAFDANNLFVRHRQHADNCPAILEDSGAIGCDCPVTDARYVRICKQCGLGHWMDASPRSARKGATA